MSKAVPHIVIAEDDKDSRFLVRRIIKKAIPAAIVSEATDGETALRLFSEKGADLVLVDHKIPVMSGLDLVDQIRLKDGRVAVILISNSPDAATEASAHGVNHFLDKAHMLRDLPLLLLTTFKADA